MAESKNRDPLSISTVPRDLLNIGSRFADIHPLGYGGGGLVFSAKDLTHNRNICIKKISFFDQHSCRQALREVKIIRQLNHENITKLHEVLNSDGTSLHHSDQDDAGNSRTVFFVQELLDTDLRHLINSKQLNHSHIKLLMYQFFRGLKYIHSANVLHRDLKPANLFINCDTLVLKIGDFGTSRVVDPNYDHSGHLTAHVGTCWYRSPEAVLSPSDYSRATDLWSAGCITAECFLGAPMFPGAHELDQILHVIDTIHLMDQDWTKVLKVMPNKLLKNHPFRPRTPLRQKLAGADPQALDVIEAVLAFDPKSRLSAEETLSHPYFEQYSCLKEEPISAQPFWIEHEVDDLPLETLQVSLIQEVQALTTSPPVDGLPSPAETQQDETHTLEEIFHMPGPTRGPTRGQESRHSSGGSSTGNPSSKHNVRNQNAKNRRRGDNTSTVTLENIRNSQNTLRNRQNILDISGQKPGEEGSQGTDTESVSEVVRKIVKTTESEEEKDIADCSPRKIREDQELGINEIIHRSEELDLDVDKSGDHNNDVVHMYSHMLEVQIDDTENLKEFSQPSPKNLSPSQSITGCRVAGHNSPVTQSGPNRGHAVVRGAVGVRHRNPGRPPPERDNKEEFSKKQRLKEEAAITISRKLILDKIETEKDMNIEQSTHHSSLTSEELDELYRLPTDHLSENRDLSNERLKHQHIARRNPSPWSHQIQGRKHHQSINERFKEDKFYQGEAGACGGYEHSPDLSDHSEPEEILQSLLADNITSHFAQARDSVSPARSLYDIDINLDVLPMTTPEQAPPTRDPLSSPESPPSPNGVRSGARPKKSPKKQRAL